MIQIFGTKKCKATQKTERFLKERNVKYHLVDLTQKGMSMGELKSVCSSISPEDLIDTDSKRFEKRGLKYMKYNIMEELFEDPLLIKTPVVRYKGKAIVGYDPDILKQWVAEEKG